YEVLGQQGTLAAFAGALLSVINLLLAWRFLPESLAPELRGQVRGGRRRIFDVAAVRKAAATPGLGLAMVLSFFVIFWFSGMETTFALYTDDGFGMNVAETGGVFAFVGVISVIVQGGLIHRLSRRFGEVKLIRNGLFQLGLGFAAFSFAPEVGRWCLFLASALVAAGSGLYNPSLNSYTSQRAPADQQGATLGVVQSISALARVVGPVCAGLAYETFGMRGPYVSGAIGLFAMFVLAYWLAPLVRRRETPSAPVPPPSAALSPEA
ncbi:MAG TPA: MFS transporter, partial [Polyangia bacterium]